MEARKQSVKRLVEASYAVSGEQQIVTLPVKLDPRANFRGHTRSRQHVKSVQYQRGFTAMFLRSRASRLPPPVKLTLVRIAPRRLDPNDNLPMAFKSVVDGIADWLELNDRSDLFCRYDQEKAETPNTYGCRIVIEPAVN